MSNTVILFSIAVLQYCNSLGRIAVLRIGIFEGKKARYNRQILKILIENKPLKPWQIAKKMAKGSMEKTQDIYSNLIRKRSGRLRELKNKGYIKRLKGGYYSPALKGIIAILVYEKNLPKIPEFYKNLLNLKFPSKIKVPFFEIEVNGKKFEKAFKEFADSLDYKEGWQTLKEMTRSFLEYGLDLDAISNEDLLNLILIKLEFDENKMEKWMKELEF